MKFLILLCFVVGALAERSCPENQHYESCGTACPLTCDNYNNPPKVCVLMCNPGCHCDEGYVKIPDGRCINPIQCPEESEGSCGDNEQYNECGTSCPLTCDNYLNPPKFCNLKCKIGCECAEGYVRSPEGRCVRPENCPAKDCQSKPDSGICRGYFPMWYFDPSTGSCEEFIYGGCQGNGNRYTSEEECKAHCSGAQRALDRPDCDKGPETGLCRARIPRFYYDQEAGMCKKFIYGGCGGNRNNFGTEAECYNKCGALHHPGSEICYLDADVGPCKAGHHRYFYNRKTGKCELFLYGGCLGNENNFRSQSECEVRCIA